jgi:hypothetical protein
MIWFWGGMKYDRCATSMYGMLSAKERGASTHSTNRTNAPSLITIRRQVVGTTAFGINLHTLEDESSETYKQGQALVRDGFRLGHKGCWNRAQEGCKCVPLNQGINRPTPTANCNSFRHHPTQRQLDACACIFSSTSFVNGSSYQPLLIMFPRAVTAVRWLASRFPDRSLRHLTKVGGGLKLARFRCVSLGCSAERASRRHQLAAAALAIPQSNPPTNQPTQPIQPPQARYVLRDLSNSLIAKWRADHPSPDATAAATAAALDAKVAAASEPSGAPVARSDSATDSTTSDDAAPSGARDQSPVAAADDAKRKAGLGVEPGSFLGLLLGARDKGKQGAVSPASADGAGGGDAAPRFSDTQIRMQANTFILAGYETTANTLCYSIYNIARYPRVMVRWGVLLSVGAGRFRLLGLVG